MVLEKATFDILNQLSQLLEQLDDEEYAKPLSVISGNTVGKHVRHIVEFYLCLLNGLNDGFVDYDARKRDLLLETKREYVAQTLNTINSAILRKPMDCKLKLSMSVTTNNDEKILVDTTFYRELAYNIEHVTHHYALIRIAVENAFSEVHIPENFGIAYSTIKYNESICAQ